MKTLILKNLVPFAVIVMGISGAFVTTSMQSNSEINAPRTGYILDENDDCDVQINCSDTPGAICTSAGEQAFGKNAQGNCNVVLYTEP
ncbi:DUF6520 family protein [Flavobacterium sp. TAB 87]|uniref:DUF6520 family protein n=1 Tax=Flavobacterium sp. TAB 87 TaxID=1729581 RepID=UPI00076C7920|nr:DUF6520 family protein [Flavobacterium sp. TAB 87]KVV16224.1 hypothetical protein AP058_00213 [Flavobacterium sp. TAB 87]